MKRKITQTLSVFLAVIMCCSLLPFTAKAITYPQGITQSDAAEALPKAEKLVEALIKQNGGTEALKKKLYRSVCSDAALNAIFKEIYSALSENASALGSLGIDITPAGLSSALKKYPEISEAVASCADLKAVIEKSQSFKWNVTGKNGFSAAVAAMLSPMNELLYTLLCGGSYKVGVLITIKGDNGYKNAIVPILNAIACPSVMTQEKYTEAAKSDRSKMVKLLLGMIFDSLDKLTEKPVDGLCAVLPGIAFYIKNGGLSASLKTLISPLKVKIAGLISFGDLDKIIDNSSLLQNSTDLSALLGKLDLASALGLSGELRLPKIDTDEFASCGTVSNGKYTADKAAALVTLLRFVINTAKLNKNSIGSLIPGGKTTGETFNKFLAKSTDEITAMLIKILTLKPSGGVLEYNWTYPEFKPSTIEYTPKLTKENYEKVLTELDGTLNEFMKEFTDKGTLSSILGSTVYSNKLLTTIVKKLYGSLDSSGMGGLTAFFGADVSVNGVASSVEASYPRAAAALKKAGSWDKVSENAVSWGFYDGNRSGFSTALTKVLSPFAPVLKFVLAEGSLTIMDAVTVYGGAGYNTAVIPLLEALGCDAESIKTYAEYKSLSGDAVITGVTKPLFDLFDRLVNKPVYTATKILPNVIYFLNSDGISHCVQNLLYPVTQLLDSLGLDDVLPAEFTNMGETLSISSLMKTLLTEGTLPVKLPEPDLGKAASLGTAKELESKRTYNGAAVKYTYIEADQTAILVTALRYLVNALKTDENAAVVSDMLKNGMGDNEMMAMYTANIDEKLGSMTTDEVIEWLYKLLFSETPKKEHPSGEDEPIRIIYQPPKKTSKVTKSVITGVSITLAVVLILFLSRFDFGNYRDRKRHLRAKKKAMKREIKEHLHRYDTSYGGDAASFVDKGKSTDAEKIAEFSRQAEEAERRRAEAAAGRNAAQKAKAEREYVKLAIRREKAVRRAEKQSRKADKFYRQALEESERKHK